MRSVQNNGDKLFIQTFREIRRYIAVNKLGPGDLLPTEAEMRRQLGVSRNVLREAIKSMELMGMLVARPGFGTEVREFNLDFIFQNVLFFSLDNDDPSIREMFAMRKLLELSFMRSAFHNMSNEDVAHIVELADTIAEKWSQHIFFAEEDHDFHMTLFRGLNNKILNAMLEAIWAVDDGFDLESRLSHLPDTVENHRAIAAALKDHDYGAFARAMEAHFSTGKYESFATFDVR